MTDALLLFGLATLASVWWFRRRRVLAEREAGHLVDRGGLPPDPLLVADAVRRFTRRQGALAIGAWCGSIAGTVPYGLLGATPAGLAWWSALVMTGTGLGACGCHGGTAWASRVAGPRVASLTPRRLGEFVTPAELGVLYGTLALPIMTAVLGVLMLTRGDRPGRGWALLAAATSAGLLFAGTAVAWRWVLRASRPVGDAAELRWQEALRGAMVRDLCAVAIGSSWALGGLTGFSALTGWPNDFPRLLASVALAAYLTGTLGLMWVALAGTHRGRAAGGSRQVIR